MEYYKYKSYKQKYKKALGGQGTLHKKNCDLKEENEMLKNQIYQLEIFLSSANLSQIFDFNNDSKPTKKLKDSDSSEDSSDDSSDDSSEDSSEDSSKDSSEDSSKDSSSNSSSNSSSSDSSEDSSSDSSSDFSKDSSSDSSSDSSENSSND